MPQNVSGVFAHQQLTQLRVNPLRRHPIQHGPVFVDGLGSALFDGIAERGSEPQRPHPPQAILLETLVRLPHTADQPAFDVLRTTEGIAQLPVQAHRGGVHGEIPPGQVLLQVGHEPYKIRTAAVGIGPLRAVGGNLVGLLGTVGGNLVGLTVLQNGDGAVFQPGLNDPLSGKAPLRLLRQRRGTDIPVVGWHTP